MSKITDYPPGPGINGSEQVLIATPAGPASTNYTYTLAAIKAYAAAGGGGSGTVTSVGLVAPDIFTVSGSPVTASGSLTFAAVNPGAAADRVVFWDESAGKWTYLTMGTNLSITGTTLNASGGGGVAWGAISGTLSAQTDLQAALDLKAPLASPTLTGTPASTTAAVDTNTTQIATTAFVVAQAASASPANLGTAAVGTSTRYARGDHVHSSIVTTTGDILYSSSGVTLARLAIGSSNQVLAVTGGVPVWSSAFALLASPTFTGTPAAPTAAVDTNTTQLATTAFVLAQAASAAPANLGTAAVGTSTRYARGDHVHSSVVTTTGDILYSSSGVTLARLGIGSSNQVLAVSGGVPVWSSSFALLASPVFTGDPTAPTPTTGDDDTSIATTAFVQASVTAIPQNSQSAAYTLVLSDKGKHIFHPSADTTARVWTIPANASVAFALGTVITFVNQNAGGVITIAITTDTMRLAGAGTTGSRTLAANGIATAIKVTSTEWLINGTGLT